MPQMSPYNWLTLNFLFTMIFLMYIIILNFIPMKKIYSKKKKNLWNYLIKW